MLFVVDDTNCDDDRRDNNNNDDDMIILISSIRFDSIRLDLIILIKEQARSKSAWLYYWIQSLHFLLRYTVYIKNI
jgi:small-conductance mechanosensitive channel